MTLGVGMLVWYTNLHVIKCITVTNTFERLSSPFEMLDFYKTLTANISNGLQGPCAMKVLEVELSCYFQGQGWFQSKRKSGFF